MPAPGTDRSNADKQSNKSGLRMAYNANSPAAAITKGTVVALLGGGRADRVEAVTLTPSNPAHLLAPWAVAEGGLRNSGGVDSDGLVAEWAFVDFDTSTSSLNAPVYWTGTALTLTPATGRPRVGSVHKVGTVAAGGNVLVDPNAFRENYSRALAVADVADAATYSQALLEYGNGGTISLSAGGAETRTLPLPRIDGQEIVLVMNGPNSVVVTITGGVFAAGLTPGTATFNAPGQVLGLRAVNIGGVLTWRAFINDGVALT